MSEPTTTPTAPAPTPPAPAQETDWKAEARKWETRAKENAEAAKRLAELEEASKTEAQKQAERLSALESENAALKQAEQIRGWKDQVSKDTGLPATVLAGSSLEEITAHAESLKSLIPAEQPKKGALGPYVPPEGNSPKGSAGSTADAFGAAVESILS